MADTTDILSYKITVAGSQIPDTDGVLEIYTYCGINRIATAKVIIIDGDPAQQDFTASSSDTFVPGKEIEIAAGIGTTTKTIFKGILRCRYKF